MKNSNKYIKPAFIGALAATVIVAGANAWVIATTDRFVIRDLSSLPRNDVGLVLGTSATTRGGFTNPFFQGRVATAAHLYYTGKVKHLLLSGDNHTRGYDEPGDMRKSLLALGVPDSAMTVDDAGFRTLDSIVRARDVFQLSRLTIITDDFHVHRAEFLARHNGLDAVAFRSPSVPWKWSLKTRLRELGSRVRAFLDIYLLVTKPKFLGPKIDIEVAKSGTA